MTSKDAHLGLSIVLLAPIFANGGTDKTVLMLLQDDEVMGVRNETELVSFQLPDDEGLL